MQSYSQCLVRLQWNLLICYWIGSFLLRCSNAHNFNRMKTPEHERTVAMIAGSLENMEDAGADRYSLMEQQCRCR